MRFLFLVGLLVCLPCFAYHAQINCASTNITTSYTTSSPGLPLSNFGPGLNHMTVINPSSVRICIDSGQNTATSAPSSGGSNEHCVAPNTFFAWDFVTINGNIFIRADQSSCTSGIVDVDVW